MGRFEMILLIITAFLVIFTLCVFFLPHRLYAGELHGYFSFGYIGEDQDYCTEFVLSYEFSIVVLQRGIETLMEQSSTKIFFNPYRNIYFFDCRIQPFKYLFFDVSHTCIHPIYSYDKLFYDKFEGGNRTSFKVGIEW